MSASGDRTWSLRTDATRKPGGIPKMVTKTAEKTRQQEEPRSREEVRPGRSPEEMHRTFQCHTLCQILWHHMVSTRPWLLHMPQAAWTRVRPGAS
jgi:hypothetical protein